MNDLAPNTPGVYISKNSALPNSRMTVPTAVPAFIGYTPCAEYQGKSYTNKPVKITSFEAFKSFFCLPNPPAPTDPPQQYYPQYYLVKQAQQPTKSDFVKIGNDYYAILPDPNTIYYFYNSIRLFYQNGGGDAYIVSVGGYGASSGSPIKPGEHIVNSNVKLNDLLAGIKLLEQEPDPTMYICPDATLLSVADNATLMQAMLAQNEEMQTAISIFDVIGGRNPDPMLYTKDIETFRKSTGTTGLRNGVVYYPFIGSMVMQSADLNYTNLFEGEVNKLEPLLNPPTSPNSTVATILAEIENPPANPLTVRQYQSSLLAASDTYNTIMNHMLADANRLPPSSGMAGVMTMMDNNHGVWKAPVNTSMAGAISLPIRLTEEDHASLNVDANSGKSINSIREFTGQGILIWGARTLDGNNQDSRYLNVRRMMIFIEQSCRLAAREYVFRPNEQDTWTAVKATINSFLSEVWKEGGLIGASPGDAFSVECGLGTTMTSEDILNGILRITVKVAATHPAEYSVITFEQEVAPG